jgi:L-malate glycosyltransferase
MKIIFIANRAEVFSGGQISLLELLYGLDRGRYTPVVLCPGEGGMAERVRSMGIPVLLWKMPAAKTVNIFRVMSKARQLKGIIEKSGADIVHTNGVRAQFYAALAVRGTGARIVWHVRESCRDILPYEMFLSSRADRIICVSKSSGEERFRGFPSINPKLRVVYNGVNTERFKRDIDKRGAARKELEVDDGIMLAGIIGLLVPRKGHIVLFKALAKVAEKYPFLRLIVTGRGDCAYSRKLKELVRELDIEGKVIFTGPRDDINAFLSAMDIFILPSAHEGFSRVLLEAMACSLPVICSDVSGNNEAVIGGLSGILVPFGDVNTLAAAMEEVISSPEKAARLGANARKRAIENFSIQQHVSEVQKVYDELGGAEKR